MEIPNPSSIDLGGLWSFFGSAWAFIIAHPLWFIFGIPIVLLLLSWWYQLFMNRMVTHQRLTKWTIILSIVIVGIIIFYAYKAGTLNFGGAFSRLFV